MVPISSDQFRSESTLQVGVIENEFGSVAIDEMLLAQAERPAEQVAESARAHSYILS